MVFVETRRCVTAGIELKIVAAVVVVHNTTEERTIGVLICTSTDIQGVFICKVEVWEAAEFHLIGACCHFLIAVDVVFITCHQVEIVFPRKTVVVGCNELSFKCFGITPGLRKRIGLVSGNIAQKHICIVGVINRHSLGHTLGLDIRIGRSEIRRNVKSLDRLVAERKFGTEV